MTEQKQEEKKEKTFAQLQEEYAQLCTRAGHIGYQIHALNKDLEMINDTLRTLNVEAAAAQAREVAGSFAAKEVRHEGGVGGQPAPASEPAPTAAVEAVASEPKEEK